MTYIFLLKTCCIKNLFEVINDLIIYKINSMNKRIISHKMNLKNYIYKFYTGYNYLTIPLLVILTILPNLLKAEGSKEIYVGSNFTGLVMCNDFLTHCSWTGERSQFAVYNCDTLDRLYFIVNSTSEVVYLGFDPQVAGSWKSVYRIRSANGDILS